VSRVVVVSGAASGIGRSLVGALSLRGDRVLATDVSYPRLVEAAAADGWDDGRVAARHLDVSDPAGWEAALDFAEARFGPVTHLVNNAGVLSPDWLVNAGDSDIHWQVDVNVKGVIFGTRAAARRMVASRSGHIVNMGSLASLSPVPGLSVYAASKVAVRGFSLSAALELREHGVAVTVVMPDAVNTPMLDKQRSRDEAALTFSGGHELTAEDIAAAVIEAFEKRPLEVALPRSRGVLAKAAGLLPEIGVGLGPVFRRLGLRAQARRKR
jgi:3-oxoacyl-[acyl-carrier protein] reductase